MRLLMFMWLPTMGLKLVISYIYHSGGFEDVKNELIDIREGKIFNYFKIDDQGVKTYNSAPDILTQLDALQALPICLQTYLKPFYILNHFMRERN